ncbi:MAG: hypothetical protein MUF02_08115 [Acidobacteria bacterium]|jgi:hypothetical protein|nr:hypothetical protein [Acidobacteriota bacterium]
MLKMKSQALWSILIVFSPAGPETGEKGVLTIDFSEADGSILTASDWAGGGRPWQVTSKNADTKEFIIICLS